MFCSVVPRRGTHKSPKIVCGLRTPPVECSKLGKTQTIEDVRRGMVRNTGFCDQNVAAGCILELLIFGRGYMPDKLVKHAATVYNRGN